MKLFQKLANLVAARNNCQRTGNIDWETRHKDVANKLVRDHFPHGGGFDCGTRLSWELSTGEKLVFDTEYHHMNDVGYYDGWTNHRVSVNPSLLYGFRVTVGGKNKNDIKDYIAEVFSAALSLEEQGG